ncbi:MAG TPA: DUF4262 domain-containing protein [Frankiaceae bacterium]|nr:DUF4262 domain-containing protein [Frankiaceae bacterium]
MSTDRRAALARIRSSIESSGHYAYLVAGGPNPPFLYTIGLTETYGAEILIAGGGELAASDANPMIAGVVAELARAPRERWPELEIRAVDKWGVATLSPVDATWSRLLLLGAYDYYDAAHIEAWQVVPDPEHRTLDVPRMDRPWRPDANPAWRWLAHQWEYEVPPSSMAMTNISALRGAVVTEVSRWEDDYWEMFAGPGPDVAEGDSRLVPLGTMLAIDPSLEVATTLPVSGGVRRDAEDRQWRAWH